MPPSAAIGVPMMVASAVRQLFSITKSEFGHDADMTAVIRTVAPLLTKEQSQKKLQKLLAAGKGKRYYAETEGAIRYVVADNGEKGLTFAVEPIKLALSESLEKAN